MIVWQLLEEGVLNRSAFSRQPQAFHSMCACMKIYLWQLWIIRPLSDGYFLAACSKYIGKIDRMICFFNASRIVSLLLDHTNYFNRLFHCQNSCAGPQRFFLFYVMRMQKCHLNTGLKLFLKISRLRSSTVELYVWLLSRLVHHHLLCVYSI